MQDPPDLSQSQGTIGTNAGFGIIDHIEDGEDYDKLRGVFMRGHFEVIDDQALCLKIGLASAEKYMNVDVTAAEPFVREQVKKRVALIFQPEKISSWDHRKMKS